MPIMKKQLKKIVQSCFNPDFKMFTKKLGVLPRLPEYPSCYAIQNYTELYSKGLYIKSYQFFMSLSQIGYIANGLHTPGLHSLVFTI